MEAPPAVPTRSLRERLGKTRRALADRLGTLLGSGTLDTDFWSDLEDSLVAADLGVLGLGEAGDQAGEEQQAQASVDRVHEVLRSGADRL